MRGWPRSKASTAASGGLGPAANMARRLLAWEAAVGGSGGCYADGLARARDGLVGLTFFCFFCSINRGGNETASENASFTEALGERRLRLPAPENDF